MAPRYSGTLLLFSLSLSFSLPRARPPECTFNPRIPAALADKLMTDAGYWPVKSINSSGLTRRAILSRNHIAKTLENLMLLVNRSLQVTSQRILSCTSKSLDVLILQQRYIFKQYWKNISRCFLKYIILSISSSNQEQQLLSFSAILNCHKIQTTLSLYFVSSVTSQSFIKIKKNSFRKNSTRIRSREEDTRRALAGRTFSRDGIS